MKVTRLLDESMYGECMVEFIINNEYIYQNYEDFCKEYGYAPIAELNKREATERVIASEAIVANGGFVEVGICDLVDRLGYDYTKHSYEEECKMVDQWCHMWNVMLYERPREDFFRSEGIRLAKAGGFNGVVYSDLS